MQGRHPLQTSDAVGAANVHLGPSAVALIARLHKEVGMPLAKMAALLRERFGLTVTPGGLVQVLHRAARVAAPTYAALCAQIPRQSRREPRRDRLAGRRGAALVAGVCHAGDYGVSHVPRARLRRGGRGAGRRL